MPKKGHHTNKECLKYAHENGCPWNEETCHYAADNGHHTNKECLKCAHENGCTLGYFGNVRLLSGTSEHVRFEHVRPFGTSD